MYVDAFPSHKFQLLLPPAHDNMNRHAPHHHSKSLLSNSNGDATPNYPTPEHLPAATAAGIPMAVLVTVLKTLFFALGCLVSATVIYTVFTDGLPFRTELLTPWMAATLVDFYINIFALALWIVYKEANFVSSVVWIILLVCFGSITTCAYIFSQLFKLSPQETAQDPMYHVLLRHENKNQGEQKGKYFPVVAGRIVFTILGCLMIATLVYTIVTDGSPFRKELLTPWMSATLIDFYVNVVALSVWIAYKETSWFSASMWIILLICFGSATTCAYITVQLFQLSSQDPVYLVLLKRKDRPESGYART